jgi:hypothetical protein
VEGAVVARIAALSGGGVARRCAWAGAVHAATWHEAVRVLGLGIASPHDDVAIAAGAWYMAKQRRAWTTHRTTLQRHELGLASYNAGLGNVLKARARCSGAKLWDAVALCLPLVTGKTNARETTKYVDFIMRRWWPMLEAAP